MALGDSTSTETVKFQTIGGNKVVFTRAPFYNTPGKYLPEYGSWTCRGCGTSVKDTILSRANDHAAICRAL